MAEDFAQSRASSVLATCRLRRIEKGRGLEKLGCLRKLVVQNLFVGIQPKESVNPEVMNFHEVAAIRMLVAKLLFDPEKQHSELATVATIATNFAS